MEGDDITTYGRAVQYVQAVVGGAQYTIYNLHGHWAPDGKVDNPVRLEQSRNVKKFLDSFDGCKILCGDFNLAPDTRSLSMLEEGMRNLVKEHGIISTRSHYYTKDMKFADYILVSPEVRVKEFKVLPDVVSDHLPLFLDFS
ncbi:MAG: hypothetical protein A3C07_03160 [Candidatus Sungbacteria bacterium RIFCSPHIGHO2_02_FULL_47_11]|uniref:Endonuclease/exonuclease/phosphatase domain-containing protein n=1 Tax=Candidatus Sungbacteria bacterium RIFCSPHIGHO2_02_FULL_47_11 TaxID=1802270 RepID=A0A1G2KIT7_9BACT|nr:MAG: hypothetical protein A3C07_03160 [Candidatus Sungbacteria bacterium RIFCSPHIGHO2_02_FULL_47_11]